MKNRNLGIVLSYVNTGLNMVCGLFLSSYLLRCLGALDYGIYQTIASFANYLVLLQFGTGTVMTRNVAMCRAKHAPQAEIDRNVTTIWSLTCILSLVILGLSGVFYISIDEIYALTLDSAQLAYARSIFSYVTLYLIGSFLLQTLNGIALAYEHYLFSSVQGIVRTLARTICLTVLIYHYHYSRAIAQVDAIICVLQLGAAAVYIRRKLGITLRVDKLDRQILHTTAPLCLALFLQSIVNQANNNVDKFLIGVLLSPESVSLYSVAMYVYSIFSSLTTIPISMYAPMVAKEIQRSTPMERLEWKLITPCRITTIIGGGIYFGFLAVGRQFVTVIYGESYLAAWPIAIIVMTPMYLNMINGVLVNVLDAMNKRMTRSLVLIGTTLANILLTILWMQYWGMVGAALATAVCTILGQVLIMNLYYSRKLGIHVLRMFRESFKGVLLWFVLSSCIVLWVGSLIPNDLVSLIVSIVLFVGVWGTGYLCQGMTDAEKHVFARFIPGRKRDDR